VISKLTRYQLREFNRKARERKGDIQWGDMIGCAIFAVLWVLWTVMLSK